MWGASLHWGWGGWCSEADEATLTQSVDRSAHPTQSCVSEEFEVCGYHCTACMCQHLFDAICSAMLSQMGKESVATWAASHSAAARKSSKEYGYQDGDFLYRNTKESRILCGVNLTSCS